MANKPRIFVVQKTMRWDAGKGELVPKFDLAPAEEYGEIVYLLSPTAAPFNPDTILPELHAKLENITEDDYLLLVGNPALIGMVCAIAADYSQGCFNMLQWSGKDRKYLPIRVDGIYNDLAHVGGHN